MCVCVFRRWFAKCEVLTFRWSIPLPPPPTYLPNMWTAVMLNCIVKCWRSREAHHLHTPVHTYPTWDLHCKVLTFRWSASPAPLYVLTQHVNCGDADLHCKVLTFRWSTSPTHPCTYLPHMRTVVTLTCIVKCWLSGEAHHPHPWGAGSVPAAQPQRADHCCRNPRFPGTAAGQKGWLSACPGSTVLATPLRLCQPSH